MSPDKWTRADLDAQWRDVGLRVNESNRRLRRSALKLILINLFGAALIAFSTSVLNPKSNVWQQWACHVNWVAVAASLACAVANTWAWRQYVMMPVRDPADDIRVRSQKILDDEALMQRVKGTDTLRKTLHYGFLGSTLVSCALSSVPGVIWLSRAIAGCRS